MYLLFPTCNICLVSDLVRLVVSESLQYVAGCCTSCAVRVKSGQIRQPEALGISAELKSKVYTIIFILRWIHLIMLVHGDLKQGLSSGTLSARGSSELWRFDFALPKWKKGNKMEEEKKKEAVKNFSPSILALFIDKKQVKCLFILSLWTILHVFGTSSQVYYAIASHLHIGCFFTFLFSFTSL